MSKVAAMSKEETLFNLIRSKFYKGRSEVLFGKIHIIDISEEEYIDKFTNVDYRVYHSDGYCFDVKQAYASEAEDGAGGIEYHFFDDAFDDFKRINICDAIKMIQEFTPVEDNYFKR